MEEEALYAEKIEEVRSVLQKTLSAHRYNHTLGVEFTAANLAMRYGYDYKKAELAGLLHDCAKEYSQEELLLRCGEEGAPNTLHAVYAPVVAKERFGITDEEILSAVRWHSTGKADMSLLDKIIYVADFIEPGRKMIPVLPLVRKWAYKDLTYTVYLIAQRTIPYLQKINASIDTHTVDCFEYLKENGNHD